MEMSKCADGLKRNKNRESRIKMMCRRLLNFTPPEAGKFLNFDFLNAMNYEPSAMNTL